MKYIVTFFLCLLFTDAISKDKIIEKMAACVCDCMNQNEKQEDKGLAASSFIICVAEGLEPHKKSIEKLIKQIIKTDNEGEDLEALDAFYESFEKAMDKNCPGQKFDSNDLFNGLFK